MTSESVAFEALSLRKAFGGRFVLYDLELHVPHGVCLGLLGANGAGKTTLMKSLLGLIPLDGGMAKIAGENAAALSAELRGRIDVCIETALREDRRGQYRPGLGAGGAGVARIGEASHSISRFTTAWQCAIPILSR